jgi:PAS domain S-box-containing protein
MTARPDPQLYQLMADRVTDYAIFLLDPGGNIMSWNAGAAVIKQYSAAEVIGRHFSIFYTAEDTARDWPAHELELAAREGRFEDEGWRVRKDGSRFWANVVITALRDDDGQLLAYSKITRDLSERKKAEEVLRLSEERFRLLVEGVQDYAIYMLDPEGIVTSWNLGARRIKGYAAGEIIGQHFSRFYSAEDVAHGKPAAELAIAKELGRAEDEGWRIRKDGSRFWARVVVTALRDPDGRLRGFAKVTQDMTRHRHAEALETSVANVSNFIAILAHELRNPLAPIRNAVQLQKISGPGNPAHEMARQIVERQSGQLSRIVDDLLDISRISRGTMSIERKPTDFATFVARAVETARPAIEEGGHTLTVEPPEHPMQVDGDELRLNQALTNILINAARYTDPGGRLTVRVWAQEEDGNRRACVSVTDTGRGIAPDMLKAIFGMFVQGKDTLARPATGLGVGLALARAIAELHHGTLEAKSEGVGQGSEFTLCLPMLEMIPDAAGTPVRPRRKAAEAGCRVLVVDDNVDAAVMLAALLESHGHMTRTAHNGSHALAAMRSFRPEVVLLDIGMPGMTGHDVARHIRALGTTPRPFIVAITGWGTHEDVQRSLEAGFDLHLVKPVEEAQLLEVLRERIACGA